MKTIITKMNIYNYSELDETAKEKARQEIADEFFSPCSMSIQFSVMKIKEYLLNIPDVKNIRLFTWIINHLPLSTPKIYEKSMTATGEAPPRARKSKIIKIFGNPYTGTGYDYIAIETIEELKKLLKAGETVTASDFMEILYKKAENEFYKEYNNALRNDFAEKFSKENGLTFTARGVLY